MTDISRRTFLAGGLALGAIAARTAAAARAIPEITFPSTPFTLGISSGDPAATGVVLWTRLALDPLNDGGMPAAPVRVLWEVASDERMQRVVQRGETIAVPEWAHSVHVEVSGLEPDRWYWYRFHAGNESTVVGRTRTLPRADAEVNRLKFGFSSCQNYASGYFSALRHIANDDLTLMLHLGDFIYEEPPLPNRARLYVGPECTTLSHYRNRYAQTRTDADLQAAHAALPWIATWDDHEVADNYAGAISRTNDPEALFLARRAAAYQAFYEHMPMRAASAPAGPFAQIYRGIHYGTLASFFVLDTRQYRSDQPCHDGVHEPCAEMADPSLTLLGATQERWLLQGLAASARRWQLLPQQVMMAKVDLTPGEPERYSMDQWSGYDVARTRLLQFFADNGRLNPVVLSGDIHNHWVNDLQVDFRNPRSKVVGTELVCTSISSGGDGLDFPGHMAAVLAENPFVRFFNSQRGYVRCELTPTRLRADLRIVDYVTTPGAPVSTRASFEIEHGHPGARRL